MSPNEILWLYENVTIETNFPSSTSSEKHSNTYASDVCSKLTWRVTNDILPFIQLVLSINFKTTFKQPIACRLSFICDLRQKGSKNVCQDGEKQLDKIVTPCHKSWKVITTYLCKIPTLKLLETQMNAAAEQADLNNHVTHKLQIT